MRAAPRAPFPVTDFGVLAIRAVLLPGRSIAAAAAMAVLAHRLAGSPCWRNIAAPSKVAPPAGGIGTAIAWCGQPRFRRARLSAATRPRGRRDPPATRHGQAAFSPDPIKHLHAPGRVRMGAMRHAGTALDGAIDVTRRSAPESPLVDHCCSKLRPDVVQPVPSDATGARWPSHSTVRPPVRGGRAATSVGGRQAQQQSPPACDGAHAPTES
jgi:hypothetical protein